MAQNLRDGISRELRYVEYRLRKKRADKEKKKSPHQAPVTDPTANIPDGYKEAIPSNRGEEGLQLQVALAMSREEAQDAEKSEMSDKIRLEMALKESAQVAAKVVESANTSPPKVTPQTLDPWGTPAAAPASNQNTFSQENKQAVTSGFESNAWGTTTSANQSNKDPWGGSSSDFFPPANDKNSAIHSDPWSVSQPTVKSTDPWNAGAAVTSGSDPWSSVNVASPSNNQSSENMFDPFSNHNAPATAAFTPTQNFDPLKEFDNLSLQQYHTPKPLSGAEVFSADIMTPKPVLSASNALDGNNAAANQKSNPAGSFLGENAGLINMDALVTKPPQTHPYITINPSVNGQTNSNPFNPKEPTLSLNQLKVGSPAGFGMQAHSTATPVVPNMMMRTQTATSQIMMAQPMMPVAGMSMQPVVMNSGVVMQPSYNMPTMTPSNQFAVQQVTHLPPVSQQNTRIMF